MFLGTTEIIDIVNVIRDGGLIGMLVLILFSGAKGWWVFGTTHKDRVSDKQARIEELKEEVQVWRGMTQRGANNAERATNVVEIITKALEEADQEKRL